MHRYRGVIAVNALGGQHMRADQRHQRRQRRRAGADPVGQRRDAEIDALAGKALALAVERLMLAELAIDDRRQQVGSGAAARDRVERRGWLRDRLAGAAGELLPHRLDHLVGAAGWIPASRSCSRRAWPACRRSTDTSLGDGSTTRSRGRCAGNGARTGLARMNARTVVVSGAPAAAASSSAAAVSTSSSCISN